jgi:predicted nucleic acid-binding protein
MIAYLDSSVILRFVLGQVDVLKKWSQIERAICSELTRVECLRVLDRLRLTGAMAEGECAERRGLVYQLLRGIEQVSLSAAVLARASQPFSVTLGTLDAVHLSTALLWSQQRGEPISMATRDCTLASAATASGLAVVDF